VSMLTRRQVRSTRSFLWASIHRSTCLKTVCDSKEFCVWTLDDHINCSFDHRVRTITGLSRLGDYTRDVSTVMVWEVVTVWPFASFTVRVTV